ncbi:MAG: PilN domain-containing protein [Candidatus Omnitrophota bacterium]
MLLIDINLLPPDLRKKRGSKTSKDAIGNITNIPKEMVFGLVGGLFFLLVVFNLLLFVVTCFKWVQYSRGNKQWEIIALDKKKVDSVLGEMRSLQSKIASVEKVTTGKRICWAQKLNELSNNIPKGVWLNKISLSEKVLLIDGSSVSKVGEEMISVGNFASNLKNQKTFMNGLKNVEVGSIQRRKVQSIEIADFLITVKLQ